jgi:uncharacterized membrane protein YoaT (DUF817 family)
MMAGLLLWGAAYAAVAVAVTLLSTPARPLPAYLIFELVCLLPWTAWLIVKAARSSKGVGIAAMVQMCAVFTVTYIAEVTGTYAGLWTFSMTRDALCGVSIAGVPLEEYLFYPLVMNFALLNYLWICAYLKARHEGDLPVSRRTLAMVLGGASAAFLAMAMAILFLRDASVSVPPTGGAGPGGIPRFDEGPRGYAWTLVCLFSVAANLLVFLAAERWTALMLRAALPLSAVFFLICLMVELLGTGRGWWVFNGRQCSGMWVAGIPVENFPAYLTGVMLPLALFEFARKVLGEKGMP